MFGISEQFSFLLLVASCRVVQSMFCQFWGRATGSSLARCVHQPGIANSHYMSSLLASAAWSCRRATSHSRKPCTLENTGLI